MIEFSLTKEGKEKAIFFISRSHDDFLECKDYIVVNDENHKGNTIKVKTKKILPNMVHLCIDEIYLVDTSEIVAVIASKISENNNEKIIPKNICIHENTAIIIFGES